MTNHWRYPDPGWPGDDDDDYEYNTYDNNPYLYDKWGLSSNRPNLPPAFNVTFPGVDIGDTGWRLSIDPFDIFDAIPGLAWLNDLEFQIGPYITFEPLSLSLWVDVEHLFLDIFHPDTLGIREAPPFNDLENLGSWGVYNGKLSLDDFNSELNNNWQAFTSLEETLTYPGLSVDPQTGEIVHTPTRQPSTRLPEQPAPEGNSSFQKKIQETEDANLPIHECEVDFSPLSLLLYPIADAMYEAARSACPVRTGFLKNTIVLEQTGDSVFTVLARAPYARWVEGRMQAAGAVPFMRRAYYAVFNERKGYHIDIVGTVTKPQLNPYNKLQAVNYTRAVRVPIEQFSSIEYKGQGHPISCRFSVDLEGMRMFVCRELSKLL